MDDPGGAIGVDGGGGGGMPDVDRPARHDAAAGTAPAGLGAGGASVLAVDLVAGDIDALLTPPPRACVFVRFAKLTPDFLALAAPDVVVAPLFGPDFDILDLADRLAEAAFAGRLYALTAPLPRPDAVRAEVLNHAPGLAFDLVVTGRDGGRDGG
jgi:hypothetical protein